MEIEQLKRIADALEEVLRLVKEDKAETKKYLEKEKSYSKRLLPALEDSHWAGTDPWSLVETYFSLNCFGKVKASTKALGSVIIDCEDKHYNTVGA